jgi:hypothetical protein
LDGVALPWQEQLAALAGILAPQVAHVSSIAIDAPEACELCKKSGSLDQRADFQASRQRSASSLETDTVSKFARNPHVLCALTATHESWKLPGH